MKILVIDDHALFREGLCYVLRKLEEHICILEASHYEQALELVVKNTDLDLVLLDLDLPGKDGFAMLETISEYYPATPVVIISASGHRADIKRALDVGAMGYIPKSTTSSVMLNAIRLILSGGIYTPSDVADNSTAPLTCRQLEVLELMVEGCSNKQIAFRLELAEATVKMHVTNIFKGLGVNNRTQAAMTARKIGICQLNTN